MPEATAIKVVPVKVEQHPDAIDQSVKFIDPKVDHQNINQNLNKAGIPGHNSTPPIEDTAGLDALSYIDHNTRVLDSGVSTDVPKTHQSNKLLDTVEHYKLDGLDQLLTGEEQSAKPRVSDNSELFAAKQGQIDAALSERNKGKETVMQEQEPKKKGGVVNGFFEWLHR